MTAYVQIAGVVFGVYAFFHLLRIILGWSAQVSNWAIPVWASALGLLLNGALFIWAVRLGAKLRTAA